MWPPRRCPPKSADWQNLTKLGIADDHVARIDTAVPVDQAHTVAVRRSGGFAGRVRSAELDLDGDPLGPEVRRLLLQTDLSGLTTGSPAADRFVYTVALGDWQLTLPEQDGFYKELVEHPNVLRVVALSGGYSRDEANARLSRNAGVVASFSRAWIPQR